MHAFREEINKEELKNINKEIIKHAKENKIYRNGSIDNLVVGIDRNRKVWKL